MQRLSGRADAVRVGFLRVQSPRLAQGCREDMEPSFLTSVGLEAVV